ncbi:MAG: NAD(P)-dependent alcohol dehydrogenase [bacterium]|nr:NAD(P)-dependent alcohol dehydrogenase [bacterium]
MRAVEVAGQFGLDRLRLADRPDPVPGPGEILIRVAAASLNYRDLLMVRGQYNPKQPLPLIPGSDGAARVVGLGHGVDRVREGQRVCPIFALSWLEGQPQRSTLRSTLGGPIDGTLAELMVVPAASVVVVPDHLTDEEAACLPCAGTTAWNALVTHGNVQQGDTVLLQGTGGVSLMALMLLRALGARAIVTSGSDEKLERAGQLGAWQTINYRTVPEWGRAAVELTGGEGVDVVLEVGGADTLAQSLRAVRIGGRVALIGNLSGARTEIDLIPVFMRQVRLQGVLVGSRAEFEAMNEIVSRDELRPQIDRTFDLAESRTAFEHMAAGGHLGKICIRL